MTPRAKYQTTRDNPYAPEPAKIIQTSQSSTCSPCFTHSRLQKPQKGSCPWYPPLPSSPRHARLTLVLPCVATLPGVAHPLLLGTWVTNYLFNGNHLLICWSHYTWMIKPPCYFLNFYLFTVLLKYNWHTTLYKFQAYDIMIQHLYALQNDHPNLWPYKITKIIVSCDKNF